MANTLNLFRNGAIGFIVLVAFVLIWGRGFIDWLDGFIDM
jgi:hypothetical protein